MSGPVWVQKLSTIPLWDLVLGQEPALDVVTFSDALLFHEFQAMCSTLRAIWRSPLLEGAAHSVLYMLWDVDEIGLVRLTTWTFHVRLPALFDEPAAGACP